MDYPTFFSLLLYIVIRQPHVHETYWLINYWSLCCSTIWLAIWLPLLSYCMSIYQGDWTGWPGSFWWKSKNKEINFSVKEENQIKILLFIDFILVLELIVRERDTSKEKGDRPHPRIVQRKGDCQEEEERWNISLKKIPKKKNGKVALRTYIPLFHTLVSSHVYPFGSTIYSKKFTAFTLWVTRECLLIDLSI